MSDEHTHEGGIGCGACGGCHSAWRGKAGLGFLLLSVAGSLFLLALFATSLKEYSFIGRDVNALTTITVQGSGESFATPDIATASFSITEEAKTVAAARKVVDDKMKAIHKFLNEQGVAEKDIKANYSFYPKYEWQQKQVACYSGFCPQPEGRQVLVGYEVSESVELTIRGIDNDPDIAGTIVGGLADKGATNLSGPNFMLEHSDAKQNEAREMAIEKAKAKAEALAKELGVTLVRISSFNEGYNYPMAYGGAMMAKSMSADISVAPEAANIPAGENKYTSNVTIVYEIR